MVPDAPAAPSGNYTPSTPTAPAAAGGSYSPSTPTAPAAPGGNYSAGTPSAPAAAGASYVPALRVTGTMTTNGTTPLVFPDLLPAGERQGLPCWTDTGEHPDSEEGGNYLCYRDAGEWVLLKNSGGIHGFTGGAAASDPRDVVSWSPYEGTETGTPVFSIAPPAAPPAASTTYTPGTPAAPPAIS